MDNLVLPLLVDGDKNHLYAVFSLYNPYTLK